MRRGGQMECEGVGTCKCEGVGRCEYDWYLVIALTDFHHYM